MIGDEDDIDYGVDDVVDLKPAEDPQDSAPVCQVLVLLLFDKKSIFILINILRFGWALFEVIVPIDTI